MLDEAEAKGIVYSFINKPNAYWPNMPEMVITAVAPHKIGWLFYWTSSKYIETKSVEDALLGNGPILVSKYDGSFAAVGSAPPIEKRIREATKWLKKGNSL